VKSTLGEVGNGGSNDKVQASGILSVIFFKNYVLKASGVLWLKTLRNDSELG